MSLTSYRAAPPRVKGVTRDKWTCVIGVNIVERGFVWIGWIEDLAATYSSVA